MLSWADFATLLALSVTFFDEISVTTA